MARRKVTCALQLENWQQGKEYDRLSDHVGLVPVVIVSPADTALAIWQPSKP